MNLGNKDSQMVTIKQGSFKKHSGGKSVSFLTYPSEPDDDELDGISIEERKRRRGGPEAPETMDTEGKLVNQTQNFGDNKNPDAALSGSDCVVSLDTVLAKPVMQASQQQ